MKISYEPILSDKLTLDKWQQWYGSSSTHSKLIFSKIEMSEMFMKNFLKYPQSVQVYIAKKFEEKTWVYDERDIEAVVSLKMRLLSVSIDENKDIADSLIDWGCAEPYDSRSYLIKKTSESQVDQYQAEFWKFIRWAFPDYKTSNVYSIMMVTPIVEVIWMLAVLHDDQIMIDLLRQISKTRKSPSLREIILLADSWDELEGVPIEWRLHLLTTTRNDV